MKFTFIDANKVVNRLESAEGKYATRLRAVLRASIDAAETTNGLLMARGLYRDENEFYADALDRLLTDLVPAIVTAAGGLDNLKWYVPADINITPLPLADDIKEGE